jgi:hypothetical protein
MRTRALVVGSLAVGLLATPAAIGLLQRASPPPPVTPATTSATTQIVAAANAFIATLSEAERAKLVFPFGDKEQTQKWSNFPTGIYARAGIRMGDLTPAQKTAAMNVLVAALSRDGYQKVTDIVRGDEVLRTSGSGGAPAGRAGTVPTAPPQGAAPRGGGGGGRGPGAGGGRGGAIVFGEAEYYMSFVGTPSTSLPWMLQFGGHHLAINLTLVGGRSSMTPSLPAAQPATFTIDGRTIRPLGDENDKAFALMATLTPEQRAKAVLTYNVTNLVLGPGEDGKTIQPEGIPASALTPAQQTMLIGIVEEWSGIVADPFAAVRIAEIRENLANTHFAWSGPTTPGSVAYFRIQGPTLVIEYSPQGSTEHIHTIYRDPTNDYGAKLLAAR